MFWLVGCARSTFWLAISVYGGGWGKATSLLIGTASVTKKIDFNNKMIKKKTMLPGLRFKKKLDMDVKPSNRNIY